MSDEPLYMTARRREFYRRYRRTALERGSGHLLCYAEDGVTIVDRWGRPLEDVRAAGRLANELAERSLALAEDVSNAVADGTLVLDRIAGRKLFGRYDYNGQLLSHVASRDATLVHLLSEAEDEEARTRAELPHLAELVDARLRLNAS